MFFSLPSSAGPIPKGWLSNNIKPIGYSDLEHRLTIKIAIKKTGGRWYLFTAYSADKEPNGRPSALVVFDVTDPADPRRIKVIPVPPGADMSQVTLHGDLLITNFQQSVTRETMAAPAAPNPAAGPEEGIVLWDVSDPADPRQVGHWETGAYGTHRNSYPGGKYAYVTAARPGFRGMQLVVLDVSNPARPLEVMHWFEYGQDKDETLPQDKPLPSFHGPAQISPDGKALVMGYTPDVVNLDISDIAHPKLVGTLTMIPPFVFNGAQSVHTVLPYWNRKLLYVSGEARFPSCSNGEALSLQAMVDNKDPAHPFLISVFPPPVPPKSLGITDFCDRPGRFGPHNISTEIHNPDVARPNDLIHVAYFNAGLWVYDIHDPRLPTIVGYFIPPDSLQPELSQTGSSKTYIAQDTLTDTRGNIYMIGSGGLYILRDTGELDGRTLRNDDPQGSR
jgi:hypothetical protein